MKTNLNKARERIKKDFPDKQKIKQFDNYFQKRTYKEMGAINIKFKKSKKYEEIIKEYKDITFTLSQGRHCYHKTDLLSYLLTLTRNESKQNKLYI